MRRLRREEEQQLLATQIQAEIDEPVSPDRNGESGDEADPDNKESGIKKGKSKKKKLT